MARWNTHINTFGWGESSLMGISGLTIGLICEDTFLARRGQRIFKQERECGNWEIWKCGNVEMWKCAD
jgi:hypothetical protein